LPNIKQRNEGRRKKQRKKNYLNGAVIKEHAFDNGGKILKMWIKVDEFIAELKKIEKKGSVNLVISKRLEVSKKGITHSMYEDTYKPKETDRQVNKNDEDDDDDYPF